MSSSPPTLAELKLALKRVEKEERARAKEGKRAKNYRIEALKQSIANYGQLRGQSVRGWAGLTPRYSGTKSNPRSKLYQDCDAKGRPCFLTGKELKFPICYVDETNASTRCKISKVGLRAAERRAVMAARDRRHPHKEYEAIAVAARQIANELEAGRYKSGERMASEFARKWRARS